MAYTYDLVRRLTREQVTGSGARVRTFTFYTRGNRASMVVTGLYNYTVTYQYDRNNRLLTETRTGTGARTTTFTYDRNGNQLTSNSGGIVETRTYDLLNRLVRLTRPGMTAEYLYRADGLRQRKTVNGQVTEHEWVMGQIVAERNGAGQAINAFHIGIGINHLIQSHNHGFYLLNARGDVVQRVDNNGNVLRTYRYDAFGNMVLPDGRHEQSAYPGADNNPFRFTGQYWDWERGEYYLRARSFNPRLGRFTQPDPHWTIHNGNMIFGDAPMLLNDIYMPNVRVILQTGNLFVYALNDPMRFTDPSGLNVKDKVAYGIDGKGVGGVGSRSGAAPKTTAQAANAPGARAQSGIRFRNPFRSRTLTMQQPGTLTGNTANLTRAERRMVNDLISRGVNVEIVPRSTTVRMFDFRVNGVPTELKTLQNPNVNTGITGIQKGFRRQNASVVIIDARGTGLTNAQAMEMINRAAGSFDSGQLPGQVQVWIDSGIVVGGS